jgi:hypothetical protein
MPAECNLFSAPRNNDRRIYAHIGDADSTLRVGEELTAEERCYDPTGKEIDCWRFTLRLDGIRRLADGRTELRCTIRGRDRSYATTSKERSDALKSDPRRSCDRRHGGLVARG